MRGSAQFKEGWYIIQPRLVGIRGNHDSRAERRRRGDVGTQDFWWAVRVCREYMSAVRARRKGSYGDP